MAEGGGWPPPEGPALSPEGGGAASGTQRLGQGARSSPVIRQESIEWEKLMDSLTRAGRLPVLFNIPRPARQPIHAVDACTDSVYWPEGEDPRIPLSKLQY